MGEDESVISDDQLLVRARDDPAALIALYRRYYDKIFRHCVHRFLDRWVAEDVTSTVFMKVVEKLPALVTRGGNFRSWLYCVANNAINDHLRRTRRRMSKESAAGERASLRRKDSPVDGPAGLRDDRAALLRQAIVKLNERQQAIITMRYFDGMRLTDVAEILGSSPATVRSQLSRALVSLQKWLTRRSRAGNSEVYSDVQQQPTTGRSTGRSEV